jgi:hypothetical protein
LIKDYIQYKSEYAKQGVKSHFPQHCSSV